MAIYEYLSGTKQVIFDGTTTSYTFDLVRDLEASTLSRRCIASIYSISGGGTISSTSFTGSLITVNWTAAPTSGQNNISWAVGV